MDCTRPWVQSPVPPPKNNKKQTNKQTKWMDTVGHTCNPNYLGGRDWIKLKVSPGKKITRPPISTSAPVGALVLVIPATEKHKQEDYSIGQPRHKGRPYLKNNKKQKGLGTWLKWQSLAHKRPEFNPQY
jgi:hypothetical protein